jgi:RNA polymerase sigma factor (sigma-70 family)
MDLETLLQTRAFLEDISVSIRNILLAHFPEMSREEKEDIDIEVKLKLWKKAAGGKKIDNLRSYLWRVVYTTALDLVGERLSHLSLENLVECSEKARANPPELLSLDSDIEGRESKLVLGQAIDSLPERRREVLRLYLEGLDIPRIASRLQWRENQVRHLLYRGLAEIRKKLGPGGAENGTLNK